MEDPPSPGKSHRSRARCDYAGAERALSDHSAGTKCLGYEGIQLREVGIVMRVRVERLNLFIETVCFPTTSVTDRDVAA